MSQPIELLPCPFCGSPAKMAEDEVDHWNGWDYVIWIDCTAKGCLVHIETSLIGKEARQEPAKVVSARAELTAQWNRRATPALPQPDHAAWHAAIAEMKTVSEGGATITAAEYDALMARLAEELSSVRPGA